MVLLDSGIQVSHRHSSYLIGDTPASCYHITAPPVLKQAYEAKTGRVLLEEIRHAIREVPQVCSTVVSNRAVHVMAKTLSHTHPDCLQDRHDTMQSLVTMLMQNSLSWTHPGREPTPPTRYGCDSLQRLTMNKFDDEAFKLESCIHHTERHGADSTWDMLSLMKEWREGP